MLNPKGTNKLLQPSLYDMRPDQSLEYVPVIDINDCNFEIVNPQFLLRDANGRPIVNPETIDFTNAYLPDNMAIMFAKKNNYYRAKRFEQINPHINTMNKHRIEF